MAHSPAFAKPAACTLVNIHTLEAIDCQFNPSQLIEKLQVNYNRLAVPGLSHQVLQYQSTSNRQLTGIEFYVDAYHQLEQPYEVSVLDFRAFLLSLTVPTQSEDGITHSSPPRMLLIWPNFITVQAVVISVEFLYQRFALDGSPLVYTAIVALEEILDVRVTSEELREEL